MDSLPFHELSIRTKQRRQIINLTSQINEVLQGGGGQALVCISVPHCTCAMYVNEDEAGLVEDTLDAVERLSRGEWRHDRIDDNAEAHIGATLLGNAVCLPASGGKLVLGTWQRVMLVELDGPRQRTVQVTVIGA